MPLPSWETAAPLLPQAQPPNCTADAASTSSASSSSGGGGGSKGGGRYAYAPMTACKQKPTSAGQQLHAPHLAREIRRMGRAHLILHIDVVAGLLDDCGREALRLGGGHHLQHRGRKPATGGEALAGVALGVKPSGLRMEPTCRARGGASGKGRLGELQALQQRGTASKQSSAHRQQLLIIASSTTAAMPWPLHPGTSSNPCIFTARRFNIVYVIS